VHSQATPAPPKPEAEPASEDEESEIESESEGESEEESEVESDEESEAYEACVQEACGSEAKHDGCITIELPPDTPPPAKFDPPPCGMTVDDFCLSYTCEQLRELCRRRGAVVRAKDSKKVLAHRLVRT